MPAVPAGLLYVAVSSPGFKTAGSLVELQDQASATVDFALGPAPVVDLLLSIVPQEEAVLGSDFSCRIVVLIKVHSLLRT